MFLCSKPLPLSSSSCPVVFVCVCVFKQLINKCGSRQERTEEVFVWSACTMTFSPTSKGSQLLLYCILPLTTTLCHWVREGRMDPLCQGRWSQTLTMKSSSHKIYCMWTPFDRDKATHLHSPQKPVAFTGYRLNPFPSQETRGIQIWIKHVPFFHSGTSAKISHYDYWIFLLVRFLLCFSCIHTTYITAHC